MTTYSIFLLVLVFLGVITVAQGIRIVPQGIRIVPQGIRIVPQGIRIVPQGSIWTVERWGRFTRLLQPGLHIITPFVERIGHKVSVKEKVLDIESSHSITRDNVLMIVDCVCFYKIQHPEKAAYEVENLEDGIQNLVVNNIRTVLGAMTMDEALSKRDEINLALQEVVGAAMKAWGTTPTRIEIKDLAR